MAQWTLFWQPIFGLKWAKSADSSSLVALAFRNGLEYRNSAFRWFNANDLSTQCRNLVNVVPASPQFMRSKDVHPTSISSLATSAWQRHCWILWGSVQSFVGRLVLSFFQLSARGRHCYAAKATRWAPLSISSFFFWKNKLFSKMISWSRWSLRWKQIILKNISD